MSNKQPLAFMSYVRSDDEHENGNITEFRKQLEGEVKIQTGKVFPIFQDEEDIKWGDAWKERIENSIDATTFLIPIITPSFFNSPPCRNELKQFIEHEKKLKRNDLILPVYYVKCSLLEDKDESATDELAQVIAGRQWIDWRERRFEPLTSQESKEIITELAKRIGDVLPSVTIIEEKHTPSNKKKPITRIVDQMYRGDHATITEAINEANPGDKILVRPGFYQERIVMDKPLEIIGDGELSEIVIEWYSKSVVEFRTTQGKIENLTLRLNSKDGNCVDIDRGILNIEGCDISMGATCIYIRGGGDHRLRQNKIHDGKNTGISIVMTNRHPIIEDNEMFKNPVGVNIFIGGSNSILRRNKISEAIFGVMISGSREITIEDNEIFENRQCGVIAETAENIIIQRNRINKNEYTAISTQRGCSGIIEDNDLRGNLKGAWDIDDESEPNVKRARNME